MRDNGVRVFKPRSVVTASAMGSGFMALRDGSSSLWRWRRSPQGAFFLCLCKERIKETHPRRHALRAARSGSASRPGIFVRHIHVPYENAVIHDGALRVLPGPLAVPHGDPKAINSKAAASDLSGVALGAPEVRQSRRVKPAGRRTRMCGVFGRGRMPRPKIPAGTAHPARSGGRTAGGCFFCLLFFAQAKKSRAFAASGAMFDLPQTHSEGFNRNARSQ